MIGSVASYFKAYGWQPGMPSHLSRCSFDEARLNKAVLLEPDILPSFSADSFVAAGALLDGAGLRTTGLLALIELQNGDDAPSYVAGTRELLRDHALQLVELLRDGGDRAGAGGEVAPRWSS